jgi:hypothetical protein
MGIEIIPKDMAERMRQFTYVDTNTDFTREEMQLIKRLYRETFRDSPDWSCSKCMNKVITKLTKYYL